MPTPIHSSPERDFSSFPKPAAARSRATPPPGTIPSSTAARVAERASSTRSFFSFSSTSVGAPTLMTATPPASLARRSWSFSRSKSEEASSTWALMVLMRAWIASSVPRPSMMTVSSLVATTRRARPRSVGWVFSSLRPISSVMYLPPVRMAMSSSIALRRSPKEGALTARALMVPRSLLTTRVARASPSQSSQMMTRFLDTWSARSRAGRKSLTPESFLSVMRMWGSSRTVSMRSGLVTK